MSRGLLWVYWIAFFVIIGVPIAAVIDASSKWGRMDRASEEEQRKSSIRIGPNMSAGSKARNNIAVRRTSLALLAQPSLASLGAGERGR